MHKELEKFLVFAIVIIAVIWLVRHMMKSCGNVSSEPFDDTANAVPNGYDVKKLSPLYSVIAGSDFVGLPETVIPPWGVNTNNYGESDTLDGMMGNAGLEFNLCSKSCCTAQYPNGIKMKPDEFVCGSKDKFTSSSYTCNNAYQDSGCVCMTEKQSDFINSRGGNT
jgi:hypothetical protein